MFLNANEMWRSISLGFFLKSFPGFSVKRTVLFKYTPDGAQLLHGLLVRDFISFSYRVPDSVPRLSLGAPLTKVSG